MVAGIFSCTETNSVVAQRLLGHCTIANRFEYGLVPLVEGRGSNVLFHVHLKAGLIRATLARIPNKACARAAVGGWSCTHQSV
jgi:hypothetical protein